MVLSLHRLYYPKHVNYDAGLGKLALGASGQVDWQLLDSQPQPAIDAETPQTLAQLLN
jgi:hypothetical protein